MQMGSGRCDDKMIPWISCGHGRLRGAPGENTGYYYNRSQIERFRASPADDKTMWNETMNEFYCTTGYSIIILSR